MLFIHGQLINITHTQSKNRQTGEVYGIHTAEILHQIKGKSVIDYLKLDASVVPHWTKSIGKDITAEVRLYSMKTDDGGFMSGFTLADKNSVPTIQANKKTDLPTTLAAAA